MAGQQDQRHIRTRDTAALTCYRRVKMRAKACMYTQNIRTLSMKKTIYSNSQAKVVSLFTVREKVQISGELTLMTALVQL